VAPDFSLHYGKGSGWKSEWIIGGSVLNGPGPPQGPAGGLPRALDGAGPQKAVRSRLGNLRTAVIVKGGGPYNVSQIG